MLKNKTLRLVFALLMIVQIVFSSVFAYDSDITIGRLSNSQNQSNNGYFLQKAYCAGGNYYVNVSPDSVPPSATSGMRMNTIMRYVDTGVDISTGKFSYDSWFTTNWNTTSNTPRTVVKADTNFDDLEAGYKYIWMESSTSDPTKEIGSTSSFKFASFYFTNIFGVSDTTLKFHYNGTAGYETLTSTTNYAIHGGNGTLPTSYSYLVNVKFIPEPCSPDSQRPIFIGTNSATTGDFMPGSVTHHADLYAGLKFGITEPSIGDPYQTVSGENYAYISGTGQEDGVAEPLNADYTGAVTTNQRGINTGSIQIKLTYTGVASGTMDQRGLGTLQTIIFSGSDLDFDYASGGAKSWNRNFIGAVVTVKQSVLNSLLQFRKETIAYIAFVGQDWAHSLPDIVNLSGTSRGGANQLINNGITNMNPIASLGGSYGYSFNAGAGAGNIPDAYIGRDVSEITNTSYRNLNQGNPGSYSRQGSANQITSTQANLYFNWKDNRAGVAMTESGWVEVKVYNAINTVSGSYETNFVPSPDNSHIYSGAELNLAGYADNADENDYTGYIDLSILSLQTGDRIKVTTYVQDYVGNERVAVKWLDAQDYPPKPQPNPAIINISVENKNPIPLETLSSYYSAYESTYGPLSGFTTPGGATAIELVGSNAGSNLTGVFFGSNTVYGTAYVDTGLSIAKTFTSTLRARNIYGQTGEVIVNVEVTPGCSEGAGCGPQLKFYVGSTLAEAETNYPLSGTWYNNRFVKIKSSERPVLTGSAGYAVLYCAGSGAITSVDISNLDEPLIHNTPNTVETFNGSTLSLSGDYSNGLSGVIYLNGNIYLFRDLTGGIEYDTGMLLNGGPQINRTRESIITGTITITGGYITGDNLSIFSGPIIELGGGRRIYSYASPITGFDIVVENRRNSNDTVNLDYYQTKTVRFNNSWIDLTAPDMTGSNSCESPHTGTIVLTSNATGYGDNFIDNLTYDTTDDDVFVITAITADSGFTSFGDNQSSGAFIYDINANSGTRELAKNIVFTGNRSGYIHYQDRAGNTGAFPVSTTCINEPFVTVYAIPGYREASNYSFTGTVDVYVLNPSGDPLTGTLYSGYEGHFGSGGTGSFSIGRPLYGQTIGVVLHTSMHLPAMGFTGVFTGAGINSEEDGGQVFDFTTWTGRVSNPSYTGFGWFDYVDLGSLGVRSVLVPGDVYKTDTSITGSRIYDDITNSFDMSVINANLTIDDTTTSGAIDFDNKGGIISSFEQAVIIQNLQRQGRDLELDGFGGLNYVQ